MNAIRRVKNYLRDCGIGVKIGVLTAGSAGVALAAACAALLLNDVAAARSCKEGHLMALASVLGGNTSAALEFHDPKAATEFLHSLDGQPTIELACLYTVDGKRIASYPEKVPAGLPLPAPPPPGVTSNARFVEVSRPVLQHGAIVGTIYLRAAMSDVWQQVLRHVLIAGGVLVATLTASSLMAMRLQGLLLNPIQELVSAMRLVTTEGYYRVRLEPKSRDELGLLQNGFNIMLGRIHETQIALQDAHDRMEQRVEQRTAELRFAWEAAETANRAKSLFLANMSHEIRTPMTAILGYAELLVEDGQSDRQRREHVDTIRRNGEHLLRLINDILDISKIEAGKMTTEHTACSPCALAGEVVASIRAAAAARQLALEVEYCGPIPETITSDPTRLRQILINLLGNAVKFTETGGVRLVVRMLDPLDAAAPRLGFEVIDTGLGMTAEQVRVIFEPFRQADNSMTRRFGGTGLGLAISRRFARLLDGEITVESVPGVGSRFLLTVPTGPLQGQALREIPVAAPSAPLPAAADAPLAPAVRGRPLSGRVLVAEDGPDNQRLICFVLQKAGAEVTVVENGQLAIDAYHAALAEGRPYGCILMDMQMPVLDGCTAVRQLRAAGCRTPIVALTAHAMRGDRETCLEAGCDAYHSKPIQRAELLNLVEAYLRGPRQPADPGRALSLQEAAP